MAAVGETGYSSPVPSAYLAPSSLPHLPRLPLPPQSQPVMICGTFYPTTPPQPLPPSHYQYPPGPPGYYLPPPSQGGFTGYYPPTPYPPRPHFRGRFSHHRRGQGVRGQSVKWGHYECKVCSKEYKTEENYTTHLETHQKCSKCDFSAMPRVLKEHEVLHMVPDMLKFTSPEEISKWREERRKNYPTAENIAKKQQLAKEKKARGETALTPIYRYVRELVGGDDRRERRGGRGKWRGRGRRGWIMCGGRGGFGRGRGGRGRWPRGREEETGEQDMDTADREKLSPTQGATPPNAVSSNVEVKGSEGVVDEQATQEQGGDKDRDPASHDYLMKAILADAGGLGTTGGVAIPSSEDTAIAKESGGVAPPSGGTAMVEGSGGVEGAHEEKSTPTTQENTDRPAAIKGSHSGRRKRKQAWVNQQKLKKRKFADDWKTVPDMKPTLLEKLLAPEVRREQNILLQCIRHIVDTGFLGHYKTHQDLGTAQVEGEQPKSDSGTAQVEGEQPSSDSGTAQVEGEQPSSDSEAVQVEEGEQASGAAQVEGCSDLGSAQVIIKQEPGCVSEDAEAIESTKLGCNNIIESKASSESERALIIKQEPCSSDSSEETAGSSHPGPKAVVIKLEPFSDSEEAVDSSHERSEPEVIKQEPCSDSEDAVATKAISLKLSEDAVDSKASSHPPAIKIETDTVNVKLDCKVAVCSKPSLESEQTKGSCVTTEDIGTACHVVETVNKEGCD